jgi:hypothetical protein
MKLARLTGKAWSTLAGRRCSISVTDEYRAGICIIPLDDIQPHLRGPSDDVELVCPTLWTWLVGLGVVKTCWRVAERLLHYRSAITLIEVTLQCGSSKTIGYEPR